MKIVSELFDSIEQDKIILFIGAGLSKIAGCYNWNEIYYRMLQTEIIQNHVENNKLNFDELKYLERPMKHKITWCYNIFKEQDSEKIFKGIIKRALFKSDTKFKNEYIPLIIKLNTLFKNNCRIVTTNVDDLLFETELFDDNLFFDEVNEFTPDNLKQGGIFHIHGTRDNLENCLFTSDKYLLRYTEQQYNDFIHSVFNDYVVLFLGSGLTEDEILNYSSYSDNNHFALLPKNEFTLSTISFYKTQYKLIIYEYGDNDDYKLNYSFLKDFINNIIKNIKKVEFVDYEQESSSSSIL